MRQPGLGKLEWIKEEIAKKKSDEKKAIAAENKAAKGGKKGGEEIKCSRQKVGNIILWNAKKREKIYMSQVLIGLGARML